jgi:hypothetical protein
MCVLLPQMVCGTGVPGEPCVLAFYDLPAGSPEFGSTANPPEFGRTTNPPEFGRKQKGKFDHDYFIDYFGLCRYG